MIRNIKVLGVAVVAVLAMSAFVASAASASKFMSEGNVNVTVKADQTGSHVFTVDGSSITCTTAHFESAGLISSPAATVKVHPTYEGCTAFGFVNSPITTTGCDYTLSSGTESAADKFPGSLELTCSGTNKITIVAGTCEVTVSGPQTFGTGLEFVNNTAGTKTVLLDANAVKVNVNKVKDGFLCPLSGTGAGTGTYTGETTVKGFNSGSTQVGVTVEP